MRTLLIGLALGLAWGVLCTHAISTARVHFTTRGDSMQCATVGGRTYCDSGCGR